MRPSGDSIKLELSGVFGKRLLTIAVHRVARDELALPLPAGILSPALYLDAKVLSHHSGEQNPTQRNGSAARVAKGHAAPGFMVYGPNSLLEEGKYLALFRLKRLDEGGGQAAVLDTSVGGGGPANFGYGHATGRLAVNTADLPLNAWRWFPIVFQHPGGSVETRVQWPGNASLAVDAIASGRSKAATEKGLGAVRLRRSVDGSGSYELGRRHSAAAKGKVMQYVMKEPEMNFLTCNLSRPMAAMAIVILAAAHMRGSGYPAGRGPVALRQHPPRDRFGREIQPRQHAAPGGHSLGHDRLVAAELRQRQQQRAGTFAIRSTRFSVSGPRINRAPGWATTAIS